MAEVRRALVDGTRRVERASAAAPTCRPGTTTSRAVAPMTAGFPTPPEVVIRGNPPRRPRWKRRQRIRRVIRQANRDLLVSFGFMAFIFGMLLVVILGGRG